jgi:signal transduction histidine kinase
MFNPSLLEKNELVDEGMELVFSENSFCVLIESLQRTVLYVSKSFCNLFLIKLNPTALKNTSVLDNAKGFSLQFTEHEKFYHSIKTPSSSIIENEIWELRNGKTISRSFYPFIKNEILQGYIWCYQVVNTKSLQPLQETTIKNELPFEQILNLLPHPIALFKTNKQFATVNAAYINSLQKRNWVVGKTLEDWYSYENKNVADAHKRIKQLHHSISKKIITHSEETFLNDDLIKQTYLWHYVPIINEQNNLTYVLEHAINITSQKVVEEKLKQSTEHLFNVLQHCSDFIIHTNDELQINFINTSFKSFLQQKKLSNITDAFELNKYELYKKIFSVLLGEDKDYQGKISLSSPLGKEKLFKYNLLPNFTVEDGNKGILITLNDITTKETEEKQLLALIKREKELNELKTAFVNMVSHELRTPLTVISSSAEILDLLLNAGKSKEELQVHTKQIVDEVEKMTAFMQDLLMVSKIEAGKVELHKSKSSIVKLAEQLIQQQFAPYKDGRTCILQVKQKEQLLSIDSTMIRHVLQNLLNNSFKYSLHKNAPYMRISFAKNYAYISIVDEGIGIPESEVKNLFTSFFRASNTGNISGTGIGLIVVKYFTQQHYGEVFVRSTQNKGTVFTIKLPY